MKKQTKRPTQKEEEIKTPVQTTQGKVSIDNIDQFAGQFVTIQETISQVHRAKNGNIYLNIGGTYPNQKLSLVIFKDDIGLFGDLKSLENKLVRVKGKVSIYNDKPQMIINKSWQIKTI